MKRKLISYNVFENIQNSSLSNSEFELVEASEILAQALKLETLDLIAFNQDSVTYEADNGTLIRCQYKINEGKVTFHNIEQLVIDEASEQAQAKTLLAGLINALTENKTEVAQENLKNYFSLSSIKREITESCKPKAKKKKNFFDFMKDKDNKFGKAAVKSKKKLKEWKQLAENVKAFVKFKIAGPVLAEASIKSDEKGNVTTVTLPGTKLRNEAKMLSFDWKNINSDLKILRSKAKSLSENQDFCKLIATAKRYNAIAEEKLPEALEEITYKFPQVLYLTQDELAKSIHEALELTGVRNFDDATCNFLAEGILRTVVENYPEKVNKIYQLTKEPKNVTEDQYESFKKIADNFYPQLDDSSEREMQVFLDLYDAMRESLENLSNDGAIAQSRQYCGKLSNVITQKASEDLGLAKEAADWLNHIVETNLETKDWEVSNTPHMTFNGDHPRMNQIAQHGYTPSTDAEGDWGDNTPVGDGKSWKNSLPEEGRSNSWGNIGTNSWPSLDNPYMPKEVDVFKIVGEKEVENDSDQLGHSGGNDTWPSLNNPYNPKGETMYSYKMKNGPGTDLVVDM